MSDHTSIPRHTFDFSKLFIATKDFVDQHNVSEIELKSKLNANHRATAEMITRLYAKQLNHALALGDTMENGLPGFRTYNSSMATAKGCTVKTIKNHRKRLQSAGFITGEINHGAMGIELLINESVFSLRKQTKNHNFLEAEKSLKSCPNKGERKNLPPLVHVHQEQNNINSIVDNKERRLSPPLDNETYGTGTPQEQHMNTGESKNSKMEQAKSGAKFSNKNQDTGGSEKAITDDITKKSVSVSSKQGSPEDSPNKKVNIGMQSPHIVNGDTPDMSFLLGLVRQFWFYAKSILYPDMILTDVENDQILNLIWASVYRKFTVKGTVKDYQENQKILEKRIDMVAKWLSRSPNRWIPVPEVYFNQFNTRNGFDKTYQWFMKQEALKAAVRNDLVLQRAEKEWRDHDKGQGQFKNKSRLQLFEIQRKRISKIKDEKLYQEYQTLIHKYSKTKNHNDSKY
ncbi:hypothetical protein [Aquimarina algiphila]|uniref:hypothetical protein n=1 Tax=Aquimarina algiphila TaxID=2047982 RepID=UPI00232B644E|nr:hypothetical protein [Aquimarina algiphila]